MPGPRQRFFNNDGESAANCKLYTYAAGTFVPKPAFRDPAGAVPHTNPIVLDAKGEALIYWSGSYRIDLKNPDGSQITGFPVDDFNAAAGAVEGAIAALRLPDYAALRAYTGNANMVYVSGFMVTAAPSGIAGIFVRDDTDTTSADNGGTVIVVAGKRWKRPHAGMLQAAWFGAKGDGSDETAVMTALHDAVQSGQGIDYGGKMYAIFTGVAGTSSGDAIALNALPRLYNKSNINLQNGGMYAANPAVSGAKLRFPSTLTIDGCSGINLRAVVLRTKGESYGDADASAPLGFEARRAFLAQNGGHSIVVIRSKNITTDAACRFEKAGSCAAFYSSSSDEVACNGSYATAESLGYAAFAQDSWCGGASVSGFAKHRMYLNDCRSDNNGAAYGSKGCVVQEDRDCYMWVTGGTWKDAYANGSANQIGMAFQANASHLYVNGGYVENCAAIGLTTNSVADDTVLEVSNVIGRNIRTAMHIFDNTSFGVHKAKYRDCDVEISGASLWGSGALSRSTVVANMKQASVAEIDIINGRTSGAHTFAINLTASYGGIRVIGGHHTVSDRILDSAGWGGSASGTFRGYEVLSGALFRVILANTAVISNALSAPNGSINSVKNYDGTAYTYQYINFDKTVSVYSNAVRDCFSIGTLGTGLQELQITAQNLTACYQSVSPGMPRSGSVKVISISDGVAGATFKVIFAFLDNKPGDVMTLVDDAFANRRSQGFYSGPTLVGSELRYGVYLNGTAANLTPGNVYPVSYAS